MSYRFLTVVVLFSVLCAPAHLLAEVLPIHRAKMEASMAKLGDPAEGQTASYADPGYARKNGRNLKAMQKILKDIIEDFPESDFARRAQTIADTYHIPVSKDDVKAHKSLTTIMQAVTRLKDVRGSKPTFTDEKWKKANERIFIGIVQAWHGMLKKSPDSIFTTKATEILEPYELPEPKK